MLKLFTYLFLMLFFTPLLANENLDKKSIKLNGSNIQILFIKKNNPNIKRSIVLLKKTMSEFNYLINKKCIEKASNKCKKIMSKLKLQNFINSFQKELSLKTNSQKNNIIKSLRTGYALNFLKQKIKPPFKISFNVSSYMHSQEKYNFSYKIKDSMYNIPFASVEFNKGWIMTNYLNPSEKSKLNYKQMIRKIIIFAKNDMHASRLEAWSEAILKGGTSKLRDLRSLSKFKGQWGYLYFDMKDKPYCSPNIVCNFTNPYSRTVRVNFK